MVEELRVEFMCKVQKAPMVKIFLNLIYKQLLSNLKVNT